MDDSSHQIPYHENHRISYFRRFLNILITLFLLAMGCWSVFFSWPQRLARYPQERLPARASIPWIHHPDVHFAYGMEAWREMQSERAMIFFRQALSRNVFHLDAWLKLAETETELGNEEKARTILTFTTDMADGIYRWKWPQLVLARELCMDEIFFGNVNDLLSEGMLTQDTFQLMHTQLDGDAEAVIAELNPAYLEVYLYWLMRWGLPDQSAQVWEAMIASEMPGEETALGYVHFLLGHKRVSPSVDIWRQYTGKDGLTNPGFEQEITGRAFDWRYWGEKEGAWSLKRASSQASEGRYSLKITFNGKENISFHHVYKIFPVHPQKRYRVTYFVKSRGITTDQGPFVDIFGYDIKGMYQAGPTITGSRSWHEQSFEFETPADCHAAVLRLRRKPSMRFDSKIRGILWIDDFRLEEVDTDEVDDIAKMKHTD